MPFKEKDWVTVLSLKRLGQVSRVLRHGLYEVSIGEFTVQCQESNLLAAGRFGQKVKAIKGLMPYGPQSGSRQMGQNGEMKKREQKLHKNSSGKKKSTQTKSIPSIDLHGMRVDEALRYTDERLNAAILAEADGLRIVHGKGTGKIKEALHQYLKRLAVVKRFRVDEHNEGVTWVYF